MDTWDCISGDEESHCEQCRIRVLISIVHGGCC